MNFPVPVVAPEGVQTSYPIDRESECEVSAEPQISPLAAIAQTLPEAVLPDDVHGLLMRVQRVEGVRAASLLDPEVVQALAVVQRNFTAAGFGLELELQSDFGPIELFGVGDNLVAVVLEPEQDEELRAKIRICLAKVRRFIS